jgi:hypothetical protein
MSHDGGLSGGDRSSVRTEAQSSKKGRRTCRQATRMLIFLAPRFQRGLLWHSSVYAKFDERLLALAR